MDYKDYQIGQKQNSFWFRAKELLISRLLTKMVRKSKIKILNIGCGTGSDLKTINKFGDTYIIDIDSKALSLISKKQYTEKKKASACDIPYKDEFFDVVLSFDVFEHIEEDSKAFQESYRVLKKGGILIFSVPAFQSIFSSHDKALGHHRRYSKNILKKKLSLFNLSEFYYWNSTLFPFIALIRLLKKNSPPAVDKQYNLKFLDGLLYELLNIESWSVQKGIKFPYGLSFIGICRK
ncbi:MAG: methyltransferase domain-containing protein [archaeon]